ncbi:50S ribosomal protein L13 [Candidatus Parcubacteria bacterium]|nr:MAG: 50S ribosomal protein L13 [Candidatus Parcubacteria bacterium]
MDYVIDAKGKPLGRIASEIAVILQGKKSPRYEPRLSGSDRALVKNTKLITMSGTKSKQKTYYRHTGYVGHLKSTTFEHAFAKNPNRVLRDAVRRMLPKNFLNPRRLKNLVFVEENAS